MWCSLSGLLNDLSADKSIHSGLLANAMPVGKINNWIHSQHTLHRRIRTFKTCLPVGISWGQTREQREMPSRRATGDNNKVRVAAILLYVGLYPGNGLFNVDDLGGIGVPGREPIIDRDTHPAHFNHAVQQWLSLIGLVAHHPGTAMNVQQNWSALSLSHRGVDVQQPPLSRGGIAYVAHIAHTGTTETKRP